MQTLDLSMWPPLHVALHLLQEEVYFHSTQKMAHQLGIVYIYYNIVKSKILIKQKELLQFYLRRLKICFSRIVLVKMAAR